MAEDLEAASVGDETMTREQLYRRLDKRSRHAARSAGFDRKLWRELGHECAVLVSDLSGFTRITRQAGVIHFLSIFRQTLRIAEPVIEKHGAFFWKTAADNIVAAFPSVASAAEVGRALRNVDVEGVRFCIGIGYGRVLRLRDDIFGDEVNVAFKLGEDVAGPGDVLFSEAAARGMKSALRGPRSATFSGLPHAYYELR